MSRKHFEALAAIVRELPHFTVGPALKGAADPEQVGENVRNGAASMLADYCASENPSFDRGRFLAACGAR